jgi:diguanylate cyclase (GGDEF)-like protein
MNIRQIFSSFNLGIAVIDEDYTVKEWNSWLELNTGITFAEIEGHSIFDFFPDLKTPSFTRGCKSVAKFGTNVALSYKLHKYLFPIKNTGSHCSDFQYMQQTCHLIPLKDDDNKTIGIMINVHDVTERAVLEKNLKEMSYIDALTGVYNRRTFERRLEEEFARHNRSNAPLSLITLDIDKFKNINDTYGHPFGDKVLQKVSEVCTEHLRTEDFFARYGGEEFICLLVNQDADQAKNVAERLRKAIESIVMKKDSVIVRITVSLGIADTKICETVEDLIKCSDKALYEAKERGRNRTFVFSAQETNSLTNT